jgi:hypothetical protein
VITHIVMLLSVKVLLAQDVKEVTHNGSTEGREGLTANGDHLSAIGSTIMKNNPEQDIVRLPAPSSSLLYCYALVAPQ